jgi:uncharacterized protein (TIGR02302 family)
LRDEIDRLLRRWILLARLALLWESFWRLAWPLVSLAALFAALALFDGLPLLPGWLHDLILVAFAAAALVFLMRFRHLKAPGRAALLSRIERDSGLAHQPFQSASDIQLAGTGDPLSVALWRQHQESARRSVDKVSLKTPLADLASHDPVGLRFAALLLLAVSLAGAWGDIPDRLERAATPDFDWLIGSAPILQVWITPPAYTHIAPILLESMPDGQPIHVPVGSKVLAELQGGRGHADMLIDGKAQPFDELSASSQRYETILKDGHSLEIHQGWRGVANWTLDVAADKPPTIEFTDHPVADSQGRLQFGIAAKDDYGVAKASLTIHRTDRPEEPPHVVELPLSDHGTTVKQTFWQDLTSDPWAGIGVTIWPEAADEGGLKGQGEAVQIVLPQRNFTNPVARAIVALRRELVLDPRSRVPVVVSLYDILSQPDAFKGDLIVSLALSDVIARLRYDGSAESVTSVADLLWQTALRLEDGDRPQAARSLADARKALQDALAKNAPQAEIERLTTELRAAIQQYLQALAADALKHGRIIQPQEGDRVVTSDEIKRMLDQMRDMSQIGARDAARQMLDQLGQMMDQLGAAAESPKPSQQAQKQLDALAAIARDQRKLLDDTQRRLDAQPGDPSAGSPSASGQDELRQRLGQVMQGLGDLGAPIPDNLGKAEMAMRTAGRSLRNGAFDQAAKAESDALAQLEQGANAARRMLSPGGVSITSQPGGMGLGLDPLGRPLNGMGNADDQSVKIPDQADVQKSREVLDEIRRRAGQADRPPAEHDYLDRLLRQLY